MSHRHRFPLAWLLLLATIGAAGLSCRLFSPAIEPAPAAPETTSLPVSPTPARLQATQPSPTAARFPATTAPTPSPEPSGPPFTARLKGGNIQNLSSNASLQVQFDQPINPQSAELALLSFPYLPAEQSWDATRTLLTFRPVAGFTPEQDYRVFLNSALRSEADGAPASQELWLIHTRPAPRLDLVSPASGVLSELQPEVQIRFSAAMNAQSVEDALSVQPPASYNIVWHQTRQATLTFPEPLTPGRKYTFTIAAGARDQQGIALSQEARWEYSIAPLVGGISGPSSQNLKEALSIRLNYSIKKASFLESARLMDSQGQRVPGSWRWVTATQARFIQDAPLQAARQYSLVFAGKLETEAGQSLAEIPPIPYQSPPPVLSASPDLTGAPATTDVRITFMVPVDQPSVEENFRLEPPVEGSFSWRENTMIFQPSTLQIYQHYTAILDTGARAADGSSLLLEPFTWQFFVSRSLEMDTPGVSFGEYGPNAQVLDLDGRRSVQFLAWQTSSATFQLYRLTLEQFLDRYSSNFRGVVGFETGQIPTTGAALQKQWQQPISGRGWGYQNSIYETIIPTDVPAGLYVLDLSTGDVAAQLILVLTRNTLVLKQAGDQVSAWVTDINGAPRPRARVGVYARDGQLLAQGRADAQGFYSARVNRDPAPLIVVAEDSETLTGRAIEGTDITVSGLSSEWRSRYYYYGWWETVPPVETISANIHTDRPIYRPGQTVYYKAIIRLDDDAELSLPPEGTPVTVRIRDARQNIASTQSLQTSSYGSVHGEFHLAEGAMTGDYQVEVLAAGGAVQQVFKVQDYAKPDYAVTVETGAEQYVTGDPIAVDISARYYFDQPVSASARVRMYELSQEYYWRDDQDAEAGSYRWTPLWNFKEQTAVLDQNGQAQLSLIAPAAEEYSAYWYDSRWSNQRSRRLGVEVIVEDASGQSVSNFAVIRVHSASETIELDAGSYLRRPGEAFSVRGWLRGLDGEPLPGRTLTLELRTVEGRSYNFDRIVQSYQASTAAGGQVDFQVTIPAPGFYQLRLNSIDPAGRQSYLSSWVYATASGSRWVTDYIQELAVTAERDTIAPGENARLVIESSFSGPALLTFERGSVRRAQAIELAAPLTVVDVPILETDAPNVYITVNAWQAQNTDYSKTGEYGSETSLADSQLRSASVRINVPPAGKRLNVAITPGQPVYGPGETASVSLQVTDEQGSPVQAELSLAVVDEAIYALSEELSPPIFESFYGLRRNRVRTYDSMQPRRYLMVYGRGGGGGDEGGGGLRLDFPDTAAWLPVIETDPAGQAVVQIPLPDNLTTWRLTARAAAMNNRFGQNTASLVTQKAIIVRPLLPRTLTQGDTLLLSSQVHNYSAALQTLDLTMSAVISTSQGAAPAFELLSPLTQTVAIEPGQSAIAGWQVRSLLPGAAKITIKALYPRENGARGLADGVVLPLEVRPLAVLDQAALSGEFTGAFETVLPIPSGVLDSSTVRIELSRSVAGSLLNGLDALTGFPYGCVEQTMSRALPNAVVGRAFNQLGTGKFGLESDLPALVNAGLQRLYGYQHDDGGWGWWFDDATDDYQTAWVVFGLAVTSEAGYDVDPQVIARGAEYLKRALEREKGDLDPRTRAYALFSLAYSGYGNLPASLDMYETYSSLDTFSQAALALALHRLGARPQAETIIAGLAESARITGDRVYWPNAVEDGHYHAKTMSSTLRSTALALDAFVQIQPDHALLPGIVRYLMSQRRPDGWGSTNETSYAVLALTDHLLSVEAASAETPYEISLDGQLIAQGILGRGEPAVEIDLPVTAFAASSAPRLLFTTGADLRLYYHLTSRMFFPQDDLPAAGQVSLKREYFNPRTGEALDSVQSGDLVKVVLTFSLDEPAFFFLVEDRLPGGLEALNESLNTTSHAEDLYQSGGQLYYWQDLGYNYKEIRGDRVTFFITQLGEGEHTFSYLARAVRAGEFTALPAEAYAMYNTSLWGRSDTLPLTVIEQSE